MDHVYFVTGNANKVREVNAMLAGRPGAPVFTHVKLDLDELQGTAEEIVRHKWRTAAPLVKATLPPGTPFHLVVEDTALSFEALEGMPGPYVKWFGSPDMLRSMIPAGASAAARASCMFAHGVVPTEEGPLPVPRVFEGVVAGTIVAPTPVAGPEVPFDWDTIFQPRGVDRTYAQMGLEAKNAMSHRRLALDLLCAAIEE